MSFIDSTCDFCGNEYDDMGNDLKQLVGDQMWCGSCKIAKKEVLEMSEVERKANAYDELVKVFKAAQRAYWNARTDTIKIQQFDRHFAFLDIEDGVMRVQSQYGLE